MKIDRFINFKVKQKKHKEEGNLMYLKNYLKMLQLESKNLI
jgi:hypothetical protein